MPITTSCSTIIAQIKLTPQLFFLFPSSINERFAMCSIKKNAFISLGLASLSIFCDINTAGTTLPVPESAAAVCHGNSVSIVRSASPMACPDQYCLLVKRAVLNATRRNTTPIHVNFGTALLPVLQTVRSRDYEVPETKLKATHQELIVTLWKKRLGKLMLDLLNEREISGLSITGLTLQDRAVFLLMIENLLKGSYNLEKLGLDYLVNEL